MARSAVPATLARCRSFQVGNKETKKVVDDTVKELRSHKEKIEKAGEQTREVVEKIDATEKTLSEIKALEEDVDALKENADAYAQEEELKRLS